MCGKAKHLLSAGHEHLELFKSTFLGTETQMNKNLSEMLMGRESIQVYGFLFKRNGPACGLL